MRIQARPAAYNYTNSIDYRLKNDRMRQEEIARKKIEALRKKKAQSVGKLQKIPEVITEGHLTSLQVCIDTHYYIFYNI